MQTTGIGAVRSTLRAIGSLWFATVLLVLLLVALACATVFESTNTTERALHTFYHAAWFGWLMALVGANILAALLARVPYNQKQVGFVITHFSILLIFAGALVTKYVGVEGQLGLAEGQTLDHFSSRQPTLTLHDRVTGKEVSLALADTAAQGFDPVKQINAPPLILGNVQVAIDEYLPDTVIAERVTDDAPAPRLAVQVLLSASGQGEPTWLFREQVVSIGPTQAVFRMVTEEELAHLLANEQPSESRSLGTVRIEYQGGVHELALEQCTAAPADVGDTGLTVRVLRYLPHATVGQDGKTVSASSRPVNPAIEVELTLGDVMSKRLAFARFPDFESMHASPQLSDAKVLFIVPDGVAAAAPVEILTVAGGDTYVRFSWEGLEPVTKKVAVGDVVDTPWPGKKLAILQRFENAQFTREVVPAPILRKERVPAIRVSVITPNRTDQLWVRRHEARQSMIDGKPFELHYSERTIPLGFMVTLDDFEVGYYPGGRRPRSFESRITITDPISGRKVSRLISMNHPTKYAGFTLYQSSYRITDKQTVSFLSVARDPGVILVFAGYIGTMTGMMLVLVRRLRDRRQAERIAAGIAPGAHRGRGSEDIPLIQPGSACQSGSGVGNAQTSGAPRPIPVVPQPAIRGDG